MPRLTLRSKNRRADNKALTGYVGLRFLVVLCVRFRLFVLPWNEHERKTFALSSHSPPILFHPIQNRRWYPALLGSHKRYKKPYPCAVSLRDTSPKAATICFLSASGEHEHAFSSWQRCLGNISVFLQNLFASCWPFALRNRGAVDHESLGKKLCTAVE